MGRWARAAFVAFGVLGVATSACAGPREDATSAMTLPEIVTAPPVVPVPGSPPVDDPQETSLPVPPSPVSKDPYARPGWIARENARPGTTEWRIPPDSRTPWLDTPDAWIEGYADTTSARIGSTVTLFVDTPATAFHVSAYRLGWYGGARGRLIWRSGTVAGGRQPAPTFDDATGMSEAPWNPSLTVDVTLEWPPGSYLLVLESDRGGRHYVPLTVRHDAAAGALLIVSAVTTWQAYNDWGACSLYACRAADGRRRATVVSFDRPYFHPYNQGSADVLDHELPLVSLVEQLGLDASYVTDIDLHEDPKLVLSRRGVITLGHDEYYSTRMRRSLEAAVDHGVNVAFLGANAVYRHIRLEPGAFGRPSRRMVNYRTGSDPGALDDPQQATVEWRVAPLSQPEAALIGIQYSCAGVRADMRLVNTQSWVYAGTGARDGQRLEDLVGIELDSLAPPAVTPDGLEVLAASPVTCRGQRHQHVMTYYSSASGAGVFATGTINWICAIDGSCARVDAEPVVRGVTTNVLLAFAAGPAGLAFPSRENVDRYRRAIVAAPDDAPPPSDPQPSDPPPSDPPPTDPPPTNPPPTNPPPTNPPPTNPPPSDPPPTDPPSSGP